MSKVIVIVVIVNGASQCCLTYLGCRDNRMDVGYSYNNGKLEIYPSEQGVRLEVRKVV